MIYLVTNKIVYRNSSSEVFYTKLVKNHIWKLIEKVDKYISELVDETVSIIFNLF